MFVHLQPQRNVSFLSGFWRICHRKKETDSDRVPPKKHVLFKADKQKLQGKVKARGEKKIQKQQRSPAVGKWGRLFKKPEGRKEHGKNLQTKPRDYYLQPSHTVH